jgi:hypothetical protein
MRLLTRVPRRVFWENGFRTAASIANADPKQLLPILMQAQPNKLRIKNQDKEKYEEKLLAKADAISYSANRLWRTSNIYLFITHHLPVTEHAANHHLGLIEIQMQSEMQGE